MALVEVISPQIVWDGRLYDVDILDKVTVKKFTYWQIRIENQCYWVVRRLIKDMRPVVANSIKSYLGLNKLDIITTKSGSRLYLLIRSYDPDKYPEITLNTFVTQGLITEDIQEEVRKIYAFRALSGMTLNVDSSIVVRVYGTVKKVYSFFDTFLESHKDGLITETIFNRWFDVNTSEYVILADIVADIIGAPRIGSSEENDRGSVGGKSSRGTYTEAVDRFSDKLEDVISKVDESLWWYRNDVINYLIGKITP